MYSSFMFKKSLPSKVRAHNWKSDIMLALNTTTDLSLLLSFFSPCFFFQNVQTGPEPHLTSYSMSPGFFPEGNVDSA